MALLLSIAIVLATVAVVVMTIAGATTRQRALRRLYENIGTADSASSDGGHAEKALGRWLVLAGYRSPNAPAWFAATTVGAAAAALLLGQFYRAFFLDSLVTSVANIPGGAGELLAEVLRRGQWILFVLMGVAPAMAVRFARRTRTTAIEQDLPLALEMFATMAEAGLGFDAALARIVKSGRHDRPLTIELASFQVDMLAGLPRTQALRQLARRAGVRSLTTFTSSLIQAEQVGASIAETLQHQADDLRQRRREEALLKAQALPVKLVFPLVICFLPGIFVPTLAPVLYQMIQVAGSVLRSGQ